MAILKQIMKGPNEIMPFDHPVITYPQFASIKFDGFRGLNLCGERFISAGTKMKEFPNRGFHQHFQEFFAFCKVHRLITDGEVWSAHLPFNELSSVFRSFEKPIPDHICYYIFDLMTEDEWDKGTELPYIRRYLNYSQILSSFPHVNLVEQHHIVDASEAERFFEAHIAAGHEGMILRSQQAKYKHGRCTVNQDGMWKFKEFETFDAVIVDVEEQMRLKDGVERTRDELGHLEREHRQELYEPSGMVGAFKVNYKGNIFGVKPGKGFDNEWKRNAWVVRENLIGKHIEAKFMPHGTKDKPRIGSLVRFRPDLD